MKKYFYKTKYLPKNPNAKFKRCNTCNITFSIDKMENGFTCKKCYVIRYGKKRCKKCLLLRPISEYTKNYTYSDGYLSKCNNCKKIST